MMSVLHNWLPIALTAVGTSRLVQHTTGMDNGDMLGR